MQLDAALTWADLPKQDLSKTVVFVADVLRATTVMTTALANGARAVLPQPSDKDARRLFTLLIEQGAGVLLCGEKEGYKREGYDLGNSPKEFLPAVVSGKTIIHLTTNGTRALAAASGAKRTYAASFANLSAAARRLQNLEDDVERIVGVVSGREGNYCIEDMVCIGGVFASMLAPPGRDYSITDAARTAVDLYQLYRGSLLDMVRQCFHGRYLEEIGLGDDLPECVKVDSTDIAPVMRNGRIVVE
ncbi:MAG: 2-phosphosulfolactate phosphatase [Candidatus Omnitrophica bacterium]|nr:2-phosphosulfolactate phosphatase [Candidatus Omnitrophota bacterium]